MPALGLNDGMELTGDLVELEKPLTVLELVLDIKSTR
jgi:hypothetical protein